ncbi:hypothetical protein [Bacteroides thetaiotaomicron]|jgi:hypothetical protein|uniref:hypothetical protein n=1 Tax=Bacteroides thetaiotaomicron TaxID=818 RepID=UPI00232E6E54|nr:hypothetical protein [Bacteroides thetaiotaomicron]MDC2179155.1 hypothetical protein [Bacteroides thetaiotaomicron]
MKTSLKDFISDYISIVVALCLLGFSSILSSCDIFIIGRNFFEQQIFSIMFALTTALIIDIYQRRTYLEKTLSKLLKESYSDNSRVLVLQNADLAYHYLSDNLKRAIYVRNTIIHNNSYTRNGISPQTINSKEYNKTKNNLLKAGKVAWEDVVASSYKDYVDELYSSSIIEGKSKYTAFFIPNNMNIFQNFTIIDYGNGYKEVIIGWILSYSSIANTQKCYVISNQDIVSHYEDYFQALKMKESSIYEH